MPIKYFALLGSMVFLFLVTGCHSTKPEPIDREKLIENAPALSPEDFMRVTTVEEGFELQLVASEPLVSAPIAMVFDHDTRIWAVEMQGYMPNADGEGEDVPNGKVVILEDKNQDGRYEDRKVVIDSLVLPRALALVEDGLLVVEPPYLWYYEIKDDKPHSKVLVDSQYTEGGNVEAQANGLFRALDNWIYSGGSSKRYRKKGAVWLTEQTHLRGQWGITQDDVGRLYYNNNSQNLLGDYFLPGLGKNNSNIGQVAGYNERIVSDNRVYPSRPTPGVNRGYQGTVLDDLLRLKSFTAACGPMLYRGDLFGSDYYQNAFVAEPAANLIKRNILHFEKGHVNGKQAYEGREFIASDDERFRPVSLYNGPDGAMYIVDMYRGIIQHKSFLTQYLYGEIKERGLEAPLNYGRIYKVVPQGQTTKLKKLPSDPFELVKLFDSPQSWEREKAQQLLVDRNELEVVGVLKENLKQNESFLMLIHSLWTLEGLNALTEADILPLLHQADPAVQMHAISLLQTVVNERNVQEFGDAVKSLIADTVLAPYVAFQLHILDEYDSMLANEVRFQLIERYPESNIITDAILSNLANREEGFAAELQNRGVPKESVVALRVKTVLRGIQDQLENQDARELQRKYGRGIAVFKSTCQPCHGADGNGLASLAPPLNRSEWVTGDKNKLIAIVLYGLTGPIEVNNIVYQVPEVSGDMPGIVNHPDLVESDLALLLSYIRNNWNNQGSDISREDILNIKRKFEGREAPFTAEELNQW